MSDRKDYLARVEMTLVVDVTRANEIVGRPPAGDDDFDWWDALESALVEPDRLAEFCAYPPQVTVT